MPLPSAFLKVCGLAMFVPIHGLVDNMIFFVFKS